MPARNPGRKGERGTVVASRGEGWEAVPLGDVAGKIRLVPPDHPLITSARLIGTCFGDG